MVRSILSAAAIRWFVLLLLFACVVCTTAYQAGGSYALDLSSDRTAPFLVGFYSPEHAADTGLPFRWSYSWSDVRLAGVGAYPFVLHARISGDPSWATNRPVEVWVNGTKAAVLTLRNGWQDYEVPVGRGQLGISGDVDINFRMSTLTMLGDHRQLGVPMMEVRLVRSSSSPVLPAWSQLAGLLLMVAVIYIGMLLLAVPARLAGLLCMALAAGWCLALAAARPYIALAGTRLMLVVIAAVALTLALRLILGRLFARGAISPSRVQWWGLCGAFASYILLKAGGMFYPGFSPLDQYQRLHQLAAFGQDPVHFWQTYLAAPPTLGLAGQLDLGTAIPYSPFFYLLADPLNWFFPGDQLRLDVLNFIMVALEASSVFVFYYVLRRGWRDGNAGVLAGVAFAWMPLTNLLMSDGGYLSILAQWLLVAVTGGLCATYSHLNRLRALLPMALLLAMTLLAHTAMAMMLGVTLALFLLAVAIWDRPRLGQVALWSGLGVFGAFATYYVFTINLIVTQILPAMANKLHSVGGVGKDPSKLGAPLLSGFWPQLAAHYQTWPLPMSLAAYSVGALRAADRVRRPVAHDGASSVATTSSANRAYVRRRGLLLWFGVWLITFAFFSLVDLWVNLLQKHMLFAMPLLSMLSGLALSWLWRRGWAARLLVCLLIASLIWTTGTVWLNRVAFSILPPGSG